MKTVRIILGIAVCLSYCSIDTIAQLQEIEEIAQFQEVEEFTQLQEVDDFDVGLFRFGVGISVINADTDYGNYGCSYNMDLNLGLGWNKWEVLGFVYFGKDKTEGDLKYLNETWAAGSPYSTFGYGIGFRYRLFNFGKISLSPNIGVGFFDMGPKGSDLEKYPGLRKYDSSGPTVIDLGLVISHLIAINSRFYKVSFEYSHLLDTKHSKYIEELSQRYANDIKGNINKLTLRIQFTSKW